ncbi:MAG: hypothetical protein J0M24_13830 [Verrucomicrobia bacterium]|nr:hypothetical protein [Verrucomicrobiota bacterium]
MAAWKNVELSDVLAFARNERLETAWAADDSLESDRWFGVIRDTVVAQIRAKASARGTNALDDDPARIPPEFLELAALRILVQILGRLGPTSGLGGQGGSDSLALTEDQRTRLTQLEKDLDMVAKGELAVTAPDDPESEQSMTPAGPGVQNLTTETRQFTRSNLKGL